MTEDTALDVFPLSLVKRRTEGHELSLALLGLLGQPRAHFGLWALVKHWSLQKPHLTSSLCAAPAGAVWLSWPPTLAVLQGSPLTVAGDHLIH